jgi:hypothetical protein
MSTGTKKQMPQSLLSVLDSPVLQMVLDRTTPIQQLTAAIFTALDDWSLDLYSRKPGPALNSNGEFVGTDLDLATFLTALAVRGAVIAIPTYDNLRARTTREGERHLPGPRNGNIMSIYANKEVFTFGVRIKDNSVVFQDPVTGRESAGQPRNFSLLGVDGCWHEGWKTIQFSPSAPENSFLSDRNLWTDNKLVFKHFVHPNRWQTLYSRHYFVTKALIERLTDQAAFLNSEIKRLKSEGIDFPPRGSYGTSPPPSKTIKTGGDQRVTVEAMQVEVDLPPWEGSYEPLPSTSLALESAYQTRKDWVYTLIPQLTFAIRAVELAFYKYGFEGQRPEKELGVNCGSEKIPHWISGTEWQRDYVPPGRNASWSRLILFQPGVGQRSVSIRYRLFPKSERLSVKEETE